MKRERILWKKMINHLPILNPKDRKEKDFFGLVKFGNYFTNVGTQFRGLLSLVLRFLEKQIPKYESNDSLQTLFRYAKLCEQTLATHYHRASLLNSEKFGNDWIETGDQTNDVEIKHISIICNLRLKYYQKDSNFDKFEEFLFWLAHKWFKKLSEKRQVFSLKEDIFSNKQKLSSNWISIVSLVSIFVCLLNNSGTYYQIKTQIICKTKEV